MPSVKMYDMAGKEVGTKELPAELFAVEINKALLHSYVRAYLMNQRQGTHSTLTRAEVSGGGKKPWRQKGTGRARQGSIRSPQWIHGGIVFGPKPRDYRVSMNKKAKRAALRSALSSVAVAENVIVINDITATEYKTKNIVAMLKALGSEKKALIITDVKNDMLIGSAGNIPGIKTAVADNVNVYDILNADKFIISSKAVDKLQEVYA